MRKCLKRTLVIAAIFTSLFVAATETAVAACVSINFCIGLNDTNSVNGTESATQFIPVAGSNWNNVCISDDVGIPLLFVSNTTAGRSINLYDSSGNSGTAQITSTLTDGYCNYSGSTPGAQITGEAGLMSSYLLIGGTNSAETVTVSGLGAGFTSNGYKVYLFFDVGISGASKRTLCYSVCDGIYTSAVWTVDSAGDNSDRNDDGVMEWIRATGVSSAGATAGANYALFEGLSGASFTISVSGSLRGAISGMQIVANDGQPPAIDFFSAIPQVIQPGGSSVLGWSVSNADSVEIYPDIGEVSANGTVEITPSVSTLYTLVASNAFGSLTATAAVTANQGPVDVYLLGGQSNMQGKGLVSGIPAGQERVNGVLYYHSETVKGVTDPYVLYTNVTATGANNGMFGPEIGFARRMTELRAGVPMALIKYAVGGTSLISGWNPGTNTSDVANWGPQFSGFVMTVTNGLAALRDAGYQPRIAGMLWQQGEQDSKNGWDYRADPPAAITNETNSAELYETNMLRFVARVREQFAADIVPEGLRFVQGTVLPYAPVGGEVETVFPEREMINAVKLNMDEHAGSSVSVSNTSTIYCDESLTPTNEQILNNGDEVHLAAEGQLILGKLMAEHMQASGYSDWSTANSLSGNPDDDDDNDGLSNGMEFFMGTDPQSGDDASSGPVAALLPLDTSAGSAVYLTISFRQNLLRGATDSLWQVDGSFDLADWTNELFRPVLIDRINYTDGTAFFRYRTSRPVSLDTRSFLRLKLTFLN